MLKHNPLLTVVAGASVLAGAWLMPALPATAQIFSPPAPKPNRAGVYNPNFSDPWTVSPSTSAVVSNPTGITNSTLVNPTVINSSITNSTLINPTVINSGLNYPWGYAEPIALPVGVNTQFLVAEPLAPYLVVILQGYNLANYRYYRQINANAVYLQIDQQSWALLSRPTKLQLLQQIGSFYSGQGVSLFVQSYGQVGLGQYVCNAPSLCTSLVLL